MKFKNAAINCGNAAIDQKEGRLPSPPPHPPMAVLTKQEAIYLKNQMQSFANNFDYVHNYIK
jgi:hypothetical protein